MPSYAAAALIATRLSAMAPTFNKPEMVYDIFVSGRAICLLLRASSGFEFVDTNNNTKIFLNRNVYADPPVKRVTPKLIVSLDWNGIRTL